MNTSKRLKQRQSIKYSGKPKLWWTLQHIKREFNKAWNPIYTYHPWILDAPILKEGFVL